MDFEKALEEFKSNNNIVDMVTDYGIKLNNELKGLCPFHNEKTPSFSVDARKNKFKCFGCGVSGDVIDFGIMTKGKHIEDIIGYQREEREKIEHYINSKLKEVTKENQTYTYTRYYMYETDLKDVYIVKVRYKNKNDKTFRRFVADLRDKPYFCSENYFDEQVNIMPYRWESVKRAIAKGKHIYFVEGEKDVESLNKLGLCATTTIDMKLSLYVQDRLRESKIILLGDTGSAGEQKKEYIKNILLKSKIKSLNVPVLDGVELLGDNKDITDWISSGRTKEDLKKCIDESWDIKRSKYFKYVTVKDAGTEKEKVTPIKIWENLKTLLEVKGVKVRYNVINKCIEIKGEGFENVNFDVCITRIRSICTLCGFHLSKADAIDFVRSISVNTKYNPAIEYLEKCHREWDGENRIQQLYDTIEVEGDKKFAELLIMKWLLNAVHVAGNEGNKNQEGILTIQGKQGIGKTRWIKSLVPSYMIKTGLEIDPSNKDSIYKAIKYWIVELGELDATLKKEQALLKAFFTQNIDEIRLPYMAETQIFPRTTCFYASVNDKEFLKDETGNRRYWVIEAISINADHGINIDQLWGEVYAIYKSESMVPYLTTTEKEKLNKSNESNEYKTNAENLILDTFNFDIRDTSLWQRYTSTEVAEIIGNRETVNKVGRAIKKLMKSDELINLNTKFRKYLLPPLQSDKVAAKKYEYLLKRKEEATKEIEVSNKACLELF